MQLWGRDIQHQIWIYTRCPTNRSLCFWMYGFGQWWSQRLWNEAQQDSSCWCRGTPWDKVSEGAPAFAASPPLKLLTKLHPELEIKETMRPGPGLQPNVLTQGSKLWGWIEQVWVPSRQTRDKNSILTEGIHYFHYYSCIIEGCSFIWFLLHFYIPPVKAHLQAWIKY